MDKHTQPLDLVGARVGGERPIRIPRALVADPDSARLPLFQLLTAKSVCLAA